MRKSSCKILALQRSIATTIDSVEQITSRFLMIQWRCSKVNPFLELIQKVNTINTKRDRIRSRFQAANVQV